jgi:glycosyltransferase involved in cell wall biosynthesis
MFLEGYARASRHRVEIWKLPPRKWKWRMRGSAYHFADLAREPGALPPDVVLASDFLNLCDWRALAPRPFAAAPCVLYFHENQVTYPLAAQAPADFHYGWINLSSALAAEKVLFNSSYHREEFLARIEAALRLMPDHVPAGLPDRIRDRSQVFPVGIDFAPHRDALARRARPRNDPPIIVWNHRWEHDKGPDLLLRALIDLKETGARFRAIICGQAPRRRPPEFDAAARELREEIIHLGFFADGAAYRDALAGADIVLSTARHEFFGVSVVEAMYLGCLPVLPHALSYPEILPPELHPLFLYPDPGRLPRFLAAFLDRLPHDRRDEVRAAAARFDWSELAPRLDGLIAEVAALR